MPTSAYGANSDAGTFVIRDALIKRPLEPFISFLEDPSQKETITSIQMSRLQQRFQPLPDPTINFGFSSSVYWFHFSLDHQSNDIRTFLLEIDYPMVDELTVHTLSQTGEMTALHLGDKLAFDHRPIRLRNFVIPIQLRPFEKKEFYLEMKSSINLSFPITLWDSISYLEIQNQYQWSMGIFYGIAFGLLVYNLFLYISLREKAFLFYIIHTFCTIGFYSVFDGFSFQMFPKAIAWQNIAIMVFFCGSYISAIQFARYYLDIINNNPIIDKISLTLISLITITLFSILVVPTGTMSKIIVSAGIIVVSYLMIVGIIRWREGNPLAKVYLIAWASSLSTAGLAMFSALGIITDFGISVWAMKLGWVAELMLLSLGLGLRINILKAEKAKEHQQALTAKQDNKAKGEFLARMSHEIRSPLSGVLGMLKLLSDTELNAGQRRYISSIEIAGDVLVEVIDDILNYSKIEAGKVYLEHIEFNLELLVSDCTQIFEYKAVEKNLSLTVNLDPDIPAKLWGDPARIRQILNNLLANAFKFTQEGYVVIQIKLINSPTDNNDKVNLHFEVADTGIGISKINQEKLFESFNQANTSTTREFGGTGLGLTICKELTELMGGKIGVDSIEGQSSCFWFQLPLDTSPINEIQNHPNTENPSNKANFRSQYDSDQHPLSPTVYSKEENNKLRVLVVEDNDINLKVILGFLNKLNIHPDVAMDGRAGINQYKTATPPYQLILMDCEMPVINGFEATKVIRKWEADLALPKCRIIALSAHIAGSFSSQSSAAGMDSYLSKPIDYALLEACIVEIASQTDIINEYSDL
ncbi:MAG: response regulator [Pseudomonadales bacterium]|nr:response regulator [Pseudomonadales bacterium]